MDGREDKGSHAKMDTLYSLFLSNVLTIGCMNMALSILLNLLSLLIVVTVQTSLLMATILRFGVLKNPLATISVNFISLHNIRSTTYLLSKLMHTTLIPALNVNPPGNVVY